MASCRYSIKRATLAEWQAWLDALDNEWDQGQAEVDPIERALQRGAVAPDVGPADVIYHCACLDTDRRDALPGIVLSEGRLRERHVALPDVATKRRVYDAVIFRIGGGDDLRSEIEQATGYTIGAGVPVLGRSQRPTDPAGAQLILDEARRRAADETDPTERITVRMADVQPTDVIERDAVPRIRFAGE